MSIKLLPLDNMLQKVLIEKNLEEKLSTIIGDMEQEFNSSTLGIFLKVPNMEIYRFKIGRNLSHTFSKNTIFTQADPLITELAKLELIDMKYPGQYMFEEYHAGKFPFQPIYAVLEEKAKSAHTQLERRQSEIYRDYLSNFKTAAEIALLDDEDRGLLREAIKLNMTDLEQIIPSIRIRRAWQQQDGKQ